MGANFFWSRFQILEIVFQTFTFLSKIGFRPKRQDTRLLGVQTYAVLNWIQTFWATLISCRFSQTSYNFSRYVVFYAIFVYFIWILLALLRVVLQYMFWGIKNRVTLDLAVHDKAIPNTTKNLGKLVARRVTFAYKWWSKMRPYGFF